MGSPPPAARVLTRRDAPAQSRLEAMPAPPPAAPGEAVLAVGRFALTSNNVTYAVYGDAMKYWDFFPAGTDGWGQVPVWGFADVVASAVEGVAPGERFYGFLPPATHLRVRPERVTAAGFVDGAAHRAELAAVYNQYRRCATDSGWRAEDEDALMIVRPLFTTAYVLADFLHALDGAAGAQVLLSSASSKTAYATAWCLRRLGHDAVVGLTSPRNLAFVESLGCCSRALAYDAIAALDASRPAIYVDFLGDGAVRAALHRHFGAALVHDAVIGSTSMAHFDRDSSLPGARPSFFFAPAQIQRRVQAIGAQRFFDGLTAAQAEFSARALDPARPWLRIAVQRGLAAVPALLADLVAGRVAADQGLAVHLR
jgi:hypothetical protein